MLERQAASNLGVDGLAFTVARTDSTVPGRVKVRLDYSTFAQAFGGAYGARLRLVQLPPCALTTPDAPHCRTGKPVTVDNDGTAKTLTAEVEAAPAAISGSAAAATPQNATLLVAAAGSSSSQGSYQSTSLGASATWQGGGSGGDFTWSYPMQVPPVPSGLVPDVAISYSSASVDGRTANTNGQPSWVGEGFDLWPGYIERRYKSCEDDGAPKDEWGNSPGDQCWGYDNATVTWNGKGGELIKAADGTWRARGDDGTKYEKLTSSSIANGDDDGEYWKVTTTDGTQYFFGLNRVAGKPDTDSTWTTPVFGDDADEPCHKSTFADSWCQQAYRWNLDYVVDPHGNVILYTYGQEANHYGRNLKPEDETPYVRGGYLKTISYGLRKDNLSAKPPAQVTFTTAERCIPTATFDCAPSKIGTNPDKWWDVPWDLHCDSGQECKDTHGTVAPTFWSRQRLTKVTTQILKPDGSEYRPVDSWSMNHEWGTADVERDLLLLQIQHTGYTADGTETALPEVTFNHVQMDNRLDRTGDDILRYIRYRLGAIDDESGGQIDIAYSDPECSLSDLPTPETNSTRCMPVIWTPPGREDPITDWFHKYVVTSVIRTDRTGLSPDMATKYEYLGDAAWHFDDDDGLTKQKNKTWSQWRGYGHVRVLTGDYTVPSTQADTYYLRGMDGDRKTKDGGEKTVTVSDGEGGTYTDHDALAGFPLKTVQYTKPGGSVHSKTVNTPWRVKTATRERSWGTTTANVVRTDTTHTWTAKDGGGWTETKTNTDYTSTGPGVGRTTAVNDLGDITTADDDTCTRTTYADNTDAWILINPSRVESVAVACTASPARPTQVISDVRAYYDNGDFEQAPSKGNVTKLENVASYDGATPKYVTQVQTRYDAYGRTTQVTDTKGQTSTTTYTETQGLTTKAQSTSPPAKQGDATTALTSTQELDPARGHPTRTIDANNLHTDLVYDGLGRLTQVWLPNLVKGSDPAPNYQFEYRVTEGKIVAITTKTVAARGDLRTDSIQLLDGWLRPRQAQSPGPSGRLIDDTFYDDRGQVIKTYDTYPALGTPDTELFGIDAPGAVESQSHTSFDGLGRKTIEWLSTDNGDQPAQELWRTTYSYGGGNRVSVTPPAGGTPTAQITNARGQVTERRQYQAATPTGDYEATRYSYTPASQLASVTDPSGNTFTTTYDLRGRKTQTTDPDKGTTTLTYNDLDQLTSTTDARGKKIFVDYDGLGRKTATHEGTAEGPLLTTYTYDTVSRGKGKPATATRHLDGAQYTNQIRAYDVLGRIQATTINIPQKEGALVGSYTFSTAYNLDGTVQTNTVPAAGGLPLETLRYSYDDWLRPLTLTKTVSNTTTTYVGDTVYSPTGKTKILELGSAGKRVWQDFTYQHGTQRLDTATTRREGIAGTDRQATYHYTDSGNITSITDISHDGTDNQCFSYDPLQRLTQAWTQGTTDACASEPSAPAIGGPAPYWQSFTYDKAGNRTNETRHGIGGVTDTERTYTYATPGHGNRLNSIAQTGPDGERADTYTYDDAGNTLTRTIGTSPSNPAQSMEWDAEGELSKLTENGTDTSFIYDADGNRLIRKDPTGSTLYLPGTELRAVTGASTATGTRYYGYGDQTVAMRTSDGALTYLTGDAQGTSQVAVNAATQEATVRRFTPFGSVRGFDDDATWPNDKGFLGGTQDPAGLTHLGAREYDADTGRFISVDPVMSPADPQQMNGYSYANNNPITHADPDGLCPPDICGIGVMNPGHSEPAKHGGAGGCGHDCGPPGNHTGQNNRGSSGRSGSRNSAGGWGGCSRIAMYGAGVCNTPRDGLLQLAAPQGPPPPPLNWRDGLKATKWAIETYIGYDDIKKCVTGKSAGSCVWAGIGLIPVVGKAARPVTKVARIAWRARQAAAGSRAAGLGRRICNSFVPRTQVIMADGSRRSIEKIKIGDKVLAADPKTGRTSAQRVQGVIASSGDKKLVQISIQANAPQLVPGVTRVKSRKVMTGGRNATPGALIATDRHPFWVAGDINNWVKAADLKPGMWLRTSVGTYVQVTTTRHWTAHHQSAHNLTIANLHTFYVLAGSTALLVHNANECKVTGLISGPGPHAKEGAALVDGDIDDPFVRNLIDEAGNANGCHTCGATTPGTKSGSWIPDHQPPTKAVSPGTPQTAFPHCWGCARPQAGTVTQLNRGNYQFPPELGGLVDASKLGLIDLPPLP
ncbi:RHS repeat-associated core domain-containing protein [Actinomadura luteofluorescens]|uniref:RHS repeat-associated core domain-containing protein n=1 Tax=Actinomadura luteofluorescens TaxID=46163 RepID=UPI00348967BB